MPEERDAAVNLINALDRYERAVGRIAPPVIIDKCRQLKIIAIRNMPSNGVVNAKCVKNSSCRNTDSDIDNRGDKENQEKGDSCFRR